jgi:hypothetical protein
MYGVRPRRGQHHELRCRGLALFVLAAIMLQLLNMSTGTLQELGVAVALPLGHAGALLFASTIMAHLLVIMNDPTYVGAKTKGRPATIALVGVLLYGLCRRHVAAVDGPDPWCVS